MRILFWSVCAASLLAGAALAGAAEPAQTTVQAPPTPTAPASKTPPAVQCVGAEGVVYFDLGATALNADSETALRGLATARRADCATKVTVTGYTDSSGSIVRNRRLASARAAVVQKHLVSLGVPQEEIVMGGAGESAPQSTTEDRLNRRVSVVLTASPRAPVPTKNPL